MSPATSALRSVSRRGLALGAMTYLQKSVGSSIDEAFSAIQHSMDRGIKRLLVVGESARRDDLKSVIGGDDIQIITAASGEAALSVLENERADAIVLDAHLQDMGVLRFVEEDGSYQPFAECLRTPPHAWRLPVS